MLDYFRQQYIELKISQPQLTNAQIADRIGVTRQSIWNYSKEAEVKAELDRRLRSIMENANIRLRNNTDDLMRQLLELATNPKTEARVRSGALQYLLDRSMGKAAEQVNIDVNDGTTDAADVLSSFKEFLTKNGYYKPEKEDTNNE
ncbi:MAG: hypothetical protein E7425_07860 [Ruminococcaceae bacterium]|nr:hypothetical protein [Oscillospiraceae bacterium]